MGSPFMFPGGASTYLAGKTAAEQAAALARTLGSRLPGSASSIGRSIAQFAKPRVPPGVFGAGAVANALPVLTAGAAAIGGTAGAADELNRSLDEYSPTRITRNPLKFAAGLFGYPGMIEYDAPEQPKQTVSTAAAPGQIRPDLPQEVAPDYTTEGVQAPIRDELKRFGLDGESTSGAPTTEVPTAPKPTTEETEDRGYAIKAVRMPDGKVRFVSENLIGTGADGSGRGALYDPASVIDRGAAAASLREKIAPEAAALSRAATMQRLAQAAADEADPVNMIERNQFLNQRYNEQLAENLGRARTEQAMLATENDPRRAFNADVGLREADIGLREAQTTEVEQGRIPGMQADTEFTRARTAILQDPAADAVRQGTATAEQTLAFRARLARQAEQELSPTQVSAAAQILMKEGLAKTQEEAVALARQRLTANRIQQIIAMDPQLQRYFIQSGLFSGAGM